MLDQSLLGRLQHRRSQAATGPKRSVLKTTAAMGGDEASLPMPPDLPGGDQEDCGQRWEQHGTGDDPEEHSPD